MFVTNCLHYKEMFQLILSIVNKGHAKDITLSPHALQFVNYFGQNHFTQST